MPEYRIFTVGLDGHFIGCEAVVCDDDEQAIETAKRMLGDRDLKVWSGARFVAAFKRERR